MLLFLNNGALACHSFCIFGEFDYLKADTKKFETLLFRLPMQVVTTRYFSSTRCVLAALFVCICGVTLSTISDVVFKQSKIVLLCCFVFCNSPTIYSDTYLEENDEEPYVLSLACICVWLRGSALRYL